MSSRTGLALALLASALAGCAGTGGQASCPPPLQSVPIVELFFGRGLPGGGEVSEADWQVFLDAEVTPRFPAGLTVFDAKGQWRQAGMLEHEDSKVLLILPFGAADRDAALAAITDAYRARFHQRSVLRIDTAGCFTLSGG
jgi:uncharacterized protein DUF3574